MLFSVFGIGFAELLIILFLGLMFLAAPIAIIVLLVVLIKKQNRANSSGGGRPPDGTADRQ